MFEVYLNGAGFRAIERQIGVHHTTIINWVKQVGKQLPEAPPMNKIPSVGELDELETFVGSKKTKFGCGQPVSNFHPGILAWVLGDHSAETFKPLWDIVCLWGCYFYVTDGWPVYASFIDSGDHIVKQHTESIFYSGALHVPSTELNYPSVVKIEEHH